MLTIARIEYSLSISKSAHSEAVNGENVLWRNNKF